MVALALLVALHIGLFPSVDVKPLQHIAFVSDEWQCAGESVAADVARFASALPLTAAWADAVKLVQVNDVSVVVLAPTTSQLALDRAGFMKLMHAQLDAMRAVAPRTWIVIAAPGVSYARDWLNAVMHKRGDGRLSYVVFPKASATRDECTTRVVEIAKEAQRHLAPDARSTSAPQQ